MTKLAAKSPRSAIEGRFSGGMAEVCWPNENRMMEMCLDDGVRYLRSKNRDAVSVCKCIEYLRELNSPKKQQGRDHSTTGPCA